MSKGLTARERAVKAALDAVRVRCDVASRRARDPVAFVHRYEDPLDRELVALVAACVAFGNVKTIRAKLEDLLERLGPRPTLASDDRAYLMARLRGWKHRVFRGDDVARLLWGARCLQRDHGCLGTLFEKELAQARTEPQSASYTADSHGAIRLALARWSGAIRTAGGLSGRSARRGPSHLLPNVLGSSGCKRLLLMLRWMVRPSDGVDLGQWAVDPALLLVPVDVHIHKLSRNLGLTDRATPSWGATEQITRALARLAPSDPCIYDFSLCHMGMLQHCPSRRDPKRCEGCGVKPVCVHWAKAAPSKL